MNTKENLQKVLGHRVLPGADCVVPYLWDHEEAHVYSAQHETKTRS